MRTITSVKLLSICALFLTFSTAKVKGQEVPTANVATYAGESVALSGPEGYRDYQWSKDGDFLADNSRISGAHKRVLKITNAQFADAGTYTLTSVTDDAKTNVTNELILINPSVETACLQTNFTFVRIVRTNRINETNEIVSITQTTSALPGVCTQTNFAIFNQTNIETHTDVARTSAAFVLNVLPPPPVPVAPTIEQFYLLTSGDSVTFVVVASGTPDPSYQWYWQGQEIPGATDSTLSFVNAQSTANAGYYSVRVSNALGQVSTPPPGLLFLKATPAGTYKGVFYDTNNPVPETSGAFQYTLSASKRTFSGKVLMGKTSYRFSGVFSEAHNAITNTLQTSSGSPLKLSLQLLTTNNLPGVVGNIGNDSWTVPLRGHRAGYGAKNPAPQFGKYTLVLQDQNTNLIRTVPDGCSFATVVVSKSGGVVMSGFAADGTKISHSSSLSASGDWPLYVPLYMNQGCMVGWLRLTNTTGTSIEGEPVHWVKNGMPSSLSYPGGFASRLRAIGSTFNTAPSLFPWPPPPVVNVIPFTEAVASFAAGDMFSADLVSPDGVAVWDFVKVFVPGPNLLVAEKSPEKLKLSVSRSMGTISGTFIHPMTGQRVPIRGKILQQQNYALGYFLSGNLSGFFALTPP